MDLAPNDGSRKLRFERLPEGSPLLGDAPAQAIAALGGGDPGGEAVALRPRGQLETGDDRVATGDFGERSDGRTEGRNGVAAHAPAFRPSVFPSTLSICAPSARRRSSMRS